jgi:hypothetical protein
MSPAKRIKSDAEELRSPEDSGGDLQASNDFVEVPAAVVCALCGDPDCMGCAEERSKSGVIAIVAWERPGPALARLWATAKSASVSAEAFFEALPDGQIMPALRFAFFAELVASTSMLGVLAGFALGLLAILGLLPDGASLAIALRVALVAVFGLTTLLVAAHATHGLSLDKGARRVTGTEPKWSRALRFGLYAAGWDLVLGPVGFFVLLFKEGPKAAFGITRIAMRLPTRSSLAFLRGAYHIDADQAKPALQTSYIGAALATVVCALVIITAVIAALVH